jgi:hypothetical protein
MTSKARRIVEQTAVGLMLRYNLFYTPAAVPVCGAFKEFDSKRGRLLQGVGEADKSIDIYESNNAG